MSIEVKVDLKLPDARVLNAAFRETKKKYLEEGGKRAQQLVQTNIRTSGMTIRSGNIVRWQTIFSSYGYSAVRAEDSSTGANSPGAITNYLEGGHAIRKPGGAAKYYKPRIRTARVSGFDFYAASQSSVAEIAAEVAAKAAAEVAEKITVG